MKQKSDRRILGLLPTELLCEILSKLSAKEIFKLCLVCRSWYDCIMQDETFMNIVWKNASEKLVHDFYYMFIRNDDGNNLSSSSLRIDMIKNDQQCKLVDGDFIDDDDLFINSPLKTTTTFSKFKKESVVRKILRLSPSAIRSKLFYMHITENTKNAALMNTSLVKTIADLITNKSITISMWFKLHSHSTGGVLFGVQNSPFSVGTAFVPVIYVTNTLTLRAGFWGAQFMEFSGILTDDKWQHVALTQSKNKSTLYFNGKVVGTTMPDHGTFDHHTHKLYHGQIGSGLCDRWPGSSMNYSCNCYTFVGDISEVNIYSKELNAQQVEEEMICAHPQPSLLASWSFTNAVPSQHYKNNEVATVPSCNKCSAPPLTVIGSSHSICFEHLDL
ncbi:hypothetical protein C9374_009185 [Naegleria lovaniensis]|uniref:F-box domain-containing protein n=1 Tax=Naegleria lovaniensis TaxID=51637 RepID=A0AA88KKC7_NAELO|nr:uncharacterized protein C9374_009185 [Naegleria lovaniensis]KAG2377669.1 hypothetical protein C9374_009185 [Naegleria lovaniensis]